MRLATLTLVVRAVTYSSPASSPEIKLMVTAEPRFRVTGDDSQKRICDLVRWLVKSCIFDIRLSGWGNANSNGEKFGQ